MNGNAPICLSEKNNQEELISFCRLLSAAAKSNLAIAPALEKIVDSQSKSRVSRIALDFAEKLKKGYSIEEATLSLRNLDPIIARLIPLLGDNRLVKVFDVYIKYLIRQELCKQKMKFLVTYPFIIMLICAAMLMYLNFSMFPSLMNFTMPSGFSSFILRLLYFADIGFWPFSLLLPLVLGYLIFDCLYVLCFGRFTAYSLWGKLTNLKRVSELCEHSKMAAAISLNLKAGLSLEKTVENVAAYVDKCDSEDMRIIANRLKNGFPLTGVVAESKLFGQLITGNESVEELPERMEYLHESFNAEAMTLLSQISEKLFYSSIIVAGIVVMAISAGYFGSFSFIAGGVL